MCRVAKMPDRAESIKSMTMAACWGLSTCLRRHWLDMLETTGWSPAMLRETAAIWLRSTITGKVTSILSKDPILVHPVDVGIGANSDTIVVADNFSHVLAATNTGGVKAKVYQNLGYDKWLHPDMSVAVTRDKHVVFGTNGRSGIYRFSGYDNALSRGPILPKPGGVAADTATQKWAATQSPNLIYVFDGEEQVKKLRLPPNKGIYRNGLLSFGLAGSVVVAARPSDNLEGDLGSSSIKPRTTTFAAFSLGSTSGWSISSSDRECLGIGTIRENRKPSRFTSGEFKQQIVARMDALQSPQQPAKLAEGSTDRLAHGDPFLRGIRCPAAQHGAGGSGGAVPGNVHAIGPASGVRPVAARPQAERSLEGRELPARSIAGEGRPKRADRDKRRSGRLAGRVPGNIARASNGSIAARRPRARRTSRENAWRRASGQFARPSIGPGRDRIAGPDPQPRTSCCSLNGRSGSVSTRQSPSGPHPDWPPERRDVRPNDRPIPADAHRPRSQGRMSQTAPINKAIARVPQDATHNFRRPSRAMPSVRPGDPWTITTMGGDRSRAPPSTQ